MLPALSYADLVNLIFFFRSTARINSQHQVNNLFNSVKEQIYH